MENFIFCAVYLAGEKPLKLLHLQDKKKSCEISVNQLKSGETRNS